MECYSKKDRFIAGTFFIFVIKVVISFKSALSFDRSILLTQQDEKKHLWCSWCMKDKEKAKNPKDILLILLLFLVGSLQVQNRQDIVSTWRVHITNHQGTLFTLAERAAVFSAMFNTSHSFMWVSDFDQIKTHEAFEILHLMWSKCLYTHWVTFLRSLQHILV